MRFSTLRVWMMCLAAVSVLMMGSNAKAQKVELSYTPKSGDSTAYDLEVHSKVTDEAGQTLDTTATSTLTISIDNVKTSPVGDETQVDEAVVDIAQTDGMVTFVSGEQKKVVKLENTHAKVVTNKDGKIVNQISGNVDKSVADMLAAICAKLGATPNPSLNMQWKVPVTLNINGEDVEVEVVYTLAGVAEVGKYNCIDISSVASFSKEFAAGSPVKTFNMQWTGHAYYNSDLGRFEQVTIEAKGNGTMADDTKAMVTDYTLQMTPKTQEAAAPAGTSALAGILRGLHLPLSMLFGIALIGGFACVIVRFRSLAVRKALVSALTIAVVLYGMPMQKAEAASPTALLAFSNIASQAMFGAAGFTMAGGAGVCMTGAPAGALSTPFAALPGMASGGVAGTYGQVGSALVQVTAAGLPAEEVAGTQEAAGGAGVFTGTNMLIGGGVIGASAGAFALASGSSGGGSSSDEDCRSYTVSTPTPATSVAQSVLVTVAPPTGNNAGNAEAADTITVSLNGTPIPALTNYALTGADGATVNLQPGTNELKFECVDGGINTWAIFDITVINPAGATQAEYYVINRVTAKACSSTPLTIPVTYQAP